MLKPGNQAIAGQIEVGLHPDICRVSFHICLKDFWDFRNFFLIVGQTVKRSVKSPRSKPDETNATKQLMFVGIH